MFENKRNLIVVYKDELVFNLLRKLIQTNDDTSDGIVGTKDNSISLVHYNKTGWKNVDKSLLQDRILYLGEIKETKNLLPVLDIKFNRSGVKYGWAGKQAVLYADPSEIKSSEEYNDFLTRLYAYPVPEKLEVPKKIIKTKESKKMLPTIAETTAMTILSPVILPIKISSDVLANLFQNKKLILQQQMAYGVFTLYYRDLEEFLSL